MLSIQISESLRLFRYYFIDLPLWASGFRSPASLNRVLRTFSPEIHPSVTGYRKLIQYTQPGCPRYSDEEIINRFCFVKIVRESDTYTQIFLNRRNIEKFFTIEGIEHLISASKSGRPVIILTGHYGSFYTPLIVFSNLGVNVYPIARTVDTSPATPPVTRMYLRLNYFLSEKKFKTRYIYTNFSGRIDRFLIKLVNSGGIIWTAIDLPARLYPHKQTAVRIFNRSGRLPGGMIEWGLKKNAIFMTAWCSIEDTGRYRPKRSLLIEEPITSGKDLKTVLQCYADRLTARVSANPWQWMGLPIIDQYLESG